MSSVEYDDYEYDDANLTDAEYEDLVRATLWPQTIEKTFVVVLMTMMVIGVIGNTLVVVVVISKKSMTLKITWLIAPVTGCSVFIEIFFLDG
ncbi:unnamed protein product [Haemonchus placei]|uniref:G_PROTEIN_RECEP_F1_2 domain-containing protein n=1 Tax=Haemonchus placei TaxID=6290 RepID=A0A0N4VTV1_HAEPC|nr:unnamed protein product [Haemonchus placei]